MFPEAPVRRRPAKRLSYKDSVRFLNTVKRYLPRDEYGRTSKLAEILGCTRRTAQRLLRTREEELPRLRKLYLQNAMSYTGLPAAELVDRVVERTAMQSKMDALSLDLAKLDKFREMSTLAASMAARCMYGHSMPASYTVESNAQFEPTAIKVQFRRLDNLTDLHEVSVVRDHFHHWRLVYTHPVMGERFRGLLKDDNFERLLNYIKKAK